MAVINALPISGAGKSTIKQVLWMSGVGTSAVLDSLNQDTNQYEEVSYVLGASSWGQGGSAQMSVTFQGSLDGSTWQTVATNGATYPASAYVGGTSSAYRYYRMVFIGTMQRGYGLVACAGEVE